MADISTQKFTNIGGDNLIVLPDTTGASNGDVLTYNTTNGIVWNAPKGGGAGTELTAGTDLTINEGIISVDTTSTAAGNYSFAVGENCYASDYGDTFACGFKTSAIGYASHAEGEGTLAYLDDAHAEGYETSAFGWQAHAEGWKTYANDEAHAEGECTSAIGCASHAEGESTVANNEATHSEGYSTSAIGFASHTEGSQTYSFGDCSHAEGSSTSSFGVGSHTEGLCTLAYDDYMHVCGQYNATDRSALFVIGNGTSTNHSDAMILSANGVVSAYDYYNAAGDKLSDLTEIISLLRNKPTTGTHVIKCIDGVLTLVAEP